MVALFRTLLLLVTAQLTWACTVNPDPIPFMDDTTRTPQDLSIGPMGEAVTVAGDAVSWQSTDGPSKPDFTDASGDGPSDGGPDHDGSAGDGPTDGGATDGDGQLNSDQGS